MDAVHRATPWATTAEVPSDDIANEVLAALGLDDLDAAVERMWRELSAYGMAGDDEHEWKRHRAGLVAALSPPATEGTDVAPNLDDSPSSDSTKGDHLDH
jgi:hypothetical protein